MPYDHRRYQVSPTGRQPIAPDFIDLMWDKTFKHEGSIVATDFSAIEERVLAWIQADGPQDTLLIGPKK